MLKAKEKLLANVKQELGNRDARRAELEQALKACEKDLEKLLAGQGGSPQAEAVREAYFAMRAAIQSKNAESERERSRLTSYLQ